MQIYKINPHVTAFYFWGDLDPANACLPVAVQNNWMSGTCQALGVACYSVHCGRAALIYDTLCNQEQAAQVRAYLEKELGCKKIYVALSHWHLDHVGGNIVFDDCPIISTRKTRTYLIANKAAIEEGSLWGEPPIKPLGLPNLTVDADASIFLDHLEVCLLPFHIHSDDGLALFIPQYGLLLPGDMLEDSATFVISPENIPTHLQELARMRRLDIQRILPNHGRSRIIEQGGYPPEFIDCISDYLQTIRSALEKDPQAVIAPLQEILRPWFDKGVISYWAPYEGVHQNNIEQIRKSIGG